MVAGRGGGSAGIYLQQTAVQPLVGARFTAVVGSVRCGALGTDGRIYRAAVADFDSNPALRHIHRLSSGGYALYCSASARSGDPLTVGVFCAGNGWRGGNYDDGVRLPV